jgi:hypothetical protein
MGVDICFLISNGFSARIVLQSEVIPSLKREGLSVAVIAPNADEDGMKETCAIPGDDFGDFELYWSQARSGCCPVKKLAMASTRT